MTVLQSGPVVSDSDALALAIGALRFASANAFPRELVDLATSILERLSGVTKAKAG